jgi:hypothetical protein
MPIVKVTVGHKTFRIVSCWQTINEKQIINLETLKGYIMGIKISRSIAFVLMVLIVLCIVPSFAFASENNYMVNAMEYNVASGNFSDMKAMELDSLSKQISMLQGIYANVNNASNVSELQQEMCTHIMVTSNTHMNIHRMNIGAGFNLATVANATDANFTDVQTNITSAIQNK